MIITDEQLEQRLLNMHTAFLGTITSLNGDCSVATIQPLDMIKQYGKNPIKQAIVENVPVAEHCRHRIKYVGHCVEETHGEGGQPANCTMNHIGMEPIRVGDVAICLCCERDISKSRHGRMDVPSGRRHSLANCVVVGVL